MGKLYTVKEVQEITGLNRKLLYDYKDVIKPSDYQNHGFEVRGGYKLYDEEALGLLKQVALFRRLGMTRKEIKQRILSGNFDTDKALEEHIEALKKKNKDIEKMIEEAENIKSIGNNE